MKPHLVRVHVTVMVEDESGRRSQSFELRTDQPGISASYLLDEMEFDIYSWVKGEVANAASS